MVSALYLLVLLSQADACCIILVVTPEDSWGLLGGRPLRADRAMAYAFLRVVIISCESIKVIPANSFRDHPNIVEVELHDGVKIIGADAFFRCISLRRVDIPGVKWTELLLKTDPVAAMEA
eukprot:scaffold13053_cov108-Skeletonema_dohrnii-CCMP3373.AAC.2